MRKFIISCFLLMFIASSSFGQQSGGNGGNNGGSQTGAAFTLDAFTSSTGWSNRGDSTPTDQSSLKYIAASTVGPCTVTAAGATSAAHELLYGSCFATAGTVSSASGYAEAQNPTFSSIGQAFTGWQSLTSTATPNFITNGTLTNPFSGIISFIPN